MERRRYTDNEIRTILDTEYGYLTTDCWDWLEQCATDERLKAECRDRWQDAYHAEEYSAEML